MKKKDCIFFVMAYLEVANLNLTLDGKRLLKDISFSIDEGTITLIAGKNGSGKSLLLKCLKGLEIPDKGTHIILNGNEMRKSKERMREISLVFQDTALQIVGSTVEKDIAFGPENLREEQSEIDKKVDDMLSLFNLEEQRTMKPDYLSGGEKRKLSIAGVLAMDTKLLLLDEPFANLDYPSTVTVINTLDSLKKRGITIVLVSHEAEKFLFHTDRTIIIKSGEIVHDDESSKSMDALRENDIYLPPNARFEELSWVQNR